MSLDRLLQRWFGDPDPTHLGSGWGSGVWSVVLGMASFAAVLCLHFPSLLTTPELRAVYPMTAVRVAIQIAIGLAFLLGLLSAVLRRRKVLGFVGMGLALAASLLGGAQVPVEGPVARSNYLGLDWFVINLLLLCVLFVPMERLFPRDPEQSAFRPGWTTDSLHFFFSHLLVQVSTLLTLGPAAIFFGWAVYTPLQEAVRAQPAVLQFLEIVLVADLAEYAIHRLFHKVPALWRFHEIHHSSERLDWLAGSRLHLVDIVLTRGFTFLPIFLLGFAPGPVLAYLTFVSFHAVFIHANVSWRFGPLEHVVVTPHFHHWHHGAEDAAIDKNFAVHLPWIDRLFGSFHAPETWPERYGTPGAPVPEGYGAQLLHPFRRRR